MRSTVYHLILNSRLNYTIMNSCCYVAVHCQALLDGITNFTPSQNTHTGPNQMGSLITTSILKTWPLP